MMKKIIRKIAYKLFPELRILTNPLYDFERLKGFQNIEDKQKSIIVYAP